MTQNIFNLGDLLRKPVILNKKDLLSGSFLYYFYGRAYRTFAEIFLPVPQDTRKARIISRPGHCIS